MQQRGKLPGFQTPAHSRAPPALPQLPEPPQCLRAAALLGATQGREAAGTALTKTGEFRPLGVFICSFK